MQLEIPLEKSTESAESGKTAKVVADANATEQALLDQQKPKEEAKPQAKLEAKPETKPETTPEAKPQADLKIEVPDKVDFVALAKEYQVTDGNLSDKTLKLLESKGITNDVVQDFIAGQKARAQVARGQLAEAVGGEESLTAVLSWASTGLTAEEVQTYNALLKSPDMAAQKVALQALKAKMDSAMGTDGERVVSAGTPGTRGIQPFASWAEVTKVMGSREYKTDPGFRAQVDKRLSVSDL